MAKKSAKRPKKGNVTKVAGTEALLLTKKETVTLSPVPPSKEFVYLQGVPMNHALALAPVISITFADPNLSEIVRACGNGESITLPKLIEYAEFLVDISITEQERRSAQAAVAFLKMYLPAVK